MLSYQARLLTTDADDAINPTSTRFQFIWDVSGTDMHGGLEHSAELYTEDILITAQSQLDVHILLFVSMFGLLGFLMSYFYRPFVKKNLHELHRIADLLSHLPADVDIEVSLINSTLMDDLAMLVVCSM